MSNHLIPISEVKVILNSQYFTRRIDECLKKGGTAGDISNLISAYLEEHFPPTK